MRFGTVVPLLAGVALLTAAPEAIPGDGSDGGTLFVDVPEDAQQGSCPRNQIATDKGCLNPPRMIMRVRPRFPKEARRHEDRGLVKILAIIEADGTVGDVEVRQSSNPGRGFEDAAVEAVKQWRYEPGTIEGRPVRIRCLLTVDFGFR